MKRLLSLNLVLLLLLCLFPTTAAGVEGTNETDMNSLALNASEETSEAGATSLQIPSDFLNPYPSGTVIPSEDSTTDTTESPFCTVAFHGNGGTTKDGALSVRVVSYMATPGRLLLFPQANTFTNGDKVLLGWHDSYLFYAQDAEYFFDPYGDEPSLNAVWEDAYTKAVCLNNYHGEPNDTTSYAGETRVIAVQAGSTYVLPNQMRGGCVFDGWRGEDGVLYPAGTSVTVADTVEFTAEFFPLSFTVDGTVYDASGSYANSEAGWFYQGGGAKTARLTIFPHYSGGPIYVPFNVNISIYKSLSGTEKTPALRVNGNASVQFCYPNSYQTDNPITLSAGDGTPAIQCSGQLRLSFSTPQNNQELMLVLSSGDNTTPALIADEIFFPVCAIYSDVIRKNRITTYSDEPYLKLVKNYSDEYPVTPLEPPIISLTTRASDGKPVISWSAVTDTTGYEVWCCGTKNGTYVKLYTAAANDFDVIHIAAEVGEDYYYKVRALYDDLEGDFSAAKGIWCDLTQPIVTVANRTSDGKPYISWTAVEGATGYEVYHCGTKNGTYAKLYTAASDDLDAIHTGAKTGEDYFYKVIALYEGNPKCNSASSTPKGVWCDLKQPTITVTNRASDGKPVISWTAVEGATGYAVYRCGTKNGTYVKMYTAPANDFDVVHTGAAVGNDYFYKVVALYGDNAKCNSAYSAAKGVWVDLKRPAIKVVNSASSGKPVISWGKVDYAVGYKVYCATGSSTGTYKLIYSTTNPDKLSVTHIGAEAGEAYFYKVVAVHKNAKCTSAYSTVKGVYCDLARPTLTVTLNSSGKPYLSWSAVEGADGYEVYRSTDSETWTLMYTSKSDDLDVNHTGAEAGATYYYKVVAICGATGKGNSAFSVVKSIAIN